jgi:hypothetical protein
LAWLWCLIDSLSAIFFVQTARFSAKNCQKFFFRALARTLLYSQRLKQLLKLKN